MSSKISAASIKPVSQSLSIFRLRNLFADGRKRMAKRNHFVMVGFVCGEKVQPVVKPIVDCDKIADRKLL